MNLYENIVLVNKRCLKGNKAYIKPLSIWNIVTIRKVDIKQWTFPYLDLSWQNTENYVT